MKSNLTDREYTKFRNGKTGDAVAVVNDDDKPLAVETSGVDWDEIITTFPTNLEELYTYKKNSTVVQTVLVTYENSNKKVILSINKVRF